jgi:peptidoglycan/LPS O-acetylase OafA/YrhL
LFCSDSKPHRIYLPAIDGLRLIAALLVFIYHFPRPLIGGPLRLIRETGWTGVDLFFVISTFLFTVLLSEEFHRTGTIKIGYFYLRRCLRIMPLYYFYLIVVLVAFTDPAWWTLTNVKRVAGLFLFVDNFIMLRNAWNTTPFSVHLWTISFEMQVYVIVPFAYLLLRRLSMRAILFICGVLALFSLLLRGVVIALGYKHPAIWAMHILRPEAILMGTIIAFALIRGYAWRIPLLIAGAIGLAVLVIMYAADQQIGAYEYWQFYVYAASAAAMGALLWEACRAGPFNAFLSLAPMRYLGKISYGIYVYHLICIEAVVLNINAPTDMLMWTAMLIAALALTIGVASASYYLIERPFLRIKNSFELVASRPA